MLSDEHTRPKSVANDSIDSIGTVAEQNAIQRNAMHSNTVVPLMLSGLQEFMIDELTQPIGLNGPWILRTKFMIALF
jgi:hypothetical protein